MKKLLLLIAILGGAIAIIRNSPAEKRQRLAELPMTMMERCMEMMPEDSPPKVMMSGVQRIQEQNDQIITLLRDRLGAQEAVAGESSAPSADPTHE